MRNVCLAVLLLMTAMCIAGCEGNQGNAGVSGSSSTMTSSSAGTSVQTPPPPPPPQRSTTTQQLPAGWSYIRQGDLNSGPLSN